MRISTLLAVLLAAGCSMKVTTRGQAFVEGHSTSDVFDQALEAVIAAEMTPTATDRSTGLIAASKAGGLMASGKDLKINLRVMEQEDGSVVVDLSATLGGQMIAYGDSRRMVEDLCESLSTRLPGATFQIDGKPYVPGAK